MILDLGIINVGTRGVSDAAAMEGPNDSVEFVLHGQLVTGPLQVIGLTLAHKGQRGFEGLPDILQL
jgi:hypothetical protein